MNSQRPDLRLLLVFEAILQEGSVTAAGRRLGLSQSATSNALNRLRQTLGDQLFVRGERGMMPTPRARELAGPIAYGLEKIHEALQPVRFVPDEATLTFNLAFSDQATMVVLPPLLHLLSKQAPNLKLRIQAKWNATIHAQLDAAAVDLAVGIMPKLPRRFGHVTLFDDTYVCLMRRGHVLAGQPLTRDKFVAAEHLAVRPSLDRANNIDATLSRLGCQRNVVLNVNQFLAVPEILRESNLIVYLLRSVAERLPQDHLFMSPVPFSNSPVRVEAAWNRAKSGDPANRWLREQVMKACEGLRSGP